MINKEEYNKLMDQVISKKTIKIIKKLYITTDTYKFISKQISEKAAKEYKDKHINLTNNIIEKYKDEIETKALREFISKVEKVYQQKDIDWGEM